MIVAHFLGDVGGRGSASVRAQQIVHDFDCDCDCDCVGGSLRVSVCGSVRAIACVNVCVSVCESVRGVYSVAFRYREMSSGCQ